MAKSYNLLLLLLLLLLLPVTSILKREGESAVG